MGDKHKTRAELIEENKLLKLRLDTLLKDAAGTKQVEGHRTFMRS